MGLRNRIAGGLHRRTPVGEGSSRVDMTPLIDVVLLLLIFFMVTSVMSPKVQVDVPLAVVTTTVDPSEAFVLTVRAGKYSRDEPRILIGDSDGTGVTIPEVQAALTRAVQEGKEQVLIRAERRVRNGTILQLSELVAAMEGGRLFFAVEPIEESAR